MIAKVVKYMTSQIFKHGVYFYTFGMALAIVSGVFIYFRI